MNGVVGGLASGFGGGSGSLGLGDCLYTFFDWEPLVGADQYHCETCGCKRDADRRVSIAQLPEVLCVHLKRFSYNQWGSKNSSPVAFPLKGLDMAPFVTHGGFIQAQKLYARAKEQQVGSALSHLLTWSNPGQAGLLSPIAAAGDSSAISSAAIGLRLGGNGGGGGSGPGGASRDNTGSSNASVVSSSSGAPSGAASDVENDTTTATTSSVPGINALTSGAGGLPGSTSSSKRASLFGSSNAAHGGSNRSLGGRSVVSSASSGSGGSGRDKDASGLVVTTPAGRKVTHTMTPETRALLLHRHAIATGITGVELVSAAASAAAGTGLAHLFSPNSAASGSSGSSPSLAASNGGGGGGASARPTTTTGNSNKGLLPSNGSVLSSSSSSGSSTPAAASLVGGGGGGTNATSNAIKVAALAALATGLASASSSAAMAASAASASASSSSALPVPSSRKALPSTMSETRYDCVSVVQHIGGLSGGHYINHGKNRGDGSWYTFDDSHVIGPIDSHAVQAKEGYLLFYTRRRAPQFAPVPIPPRGQITVPVTTAGSGSSSAAQGPMQTIPEPADFFVSMGWWLRYCMLSVPGPICNADILCDHGSLKAQLAGETENITVALTKRQYEVLATAYGATDKPLRELSPCKDCAKEAKLLQERRNREKVRIQELDTVVLPASRGGNNNGGQGDGEASDDHLRWFLMSEWWLNRWRNFINNSGPSDGSGRGILPPGPIDNARLLDKSGHPLPNQRAIIHYRGVNYKVWRFLSSIYGGGPLLKRKEINLYEGVVPPTATAAGPTTAVAPAGQPSASSRR
jgi:Ubiquitin carboxyl-terminal hydrolase/DUSP domain